MPEPARWVLDALIGGVLLEALVLAWLHRRHGRGPAPARVLPTLAAGLCLMLALRSTLVQAQVQWTALALAAAGLAHALDLYRRWPGRDRQRHGQQHCQSDSQRDSRPHARAAGRTGTSPGPAPAAPPAGG